MAKQYKLSFTGQEIDTILGKSVLTTSQELTEFEKAQVRYNIGIDEEPPGPITKELYYSYNGDKVSDDKFWLNSYTNHRSFVKVGDIPKGTLNLVGGVIECYNRPDGNKNYKITITEEMLTESVDKDGYVLNASVPGLTQIFYQGPDEYSKVTVLLVCTKAGWYDVAFDGWYEPLNITQTGIYLFDSVNEINYAGALICSHTVDNMATETLDVEFNYDGDYTPDDLVWAKTAYNEKKLVKAGELPKGTLNLLNGTLYCVSRTNEWRVYSFIITEDMLAETLDSNGHTLHATNPNYTQIFYQSVFDYVKFTQLVVCHKAGQYEIQLEGWYELITFPEPGIYFFDKAVFNTGENDIYATKLTCTVTVKNSDMEEEEEEDDQIPKPLAHTGKEIMVFSRGICIGDSVTDGSFDATSGGTVIKSHAYPTVLKRLTNIDIANAGIAGATAQSWYESSLNSDTLWGSWVNQEWVWNTNPPNTGNDVISKQLDYSGFEFAIIHLGINDLLTSDPAAINETLVTYETYINNIITKLKEENNGIKIFLATIIPSYAPESDENFALLNKKIKSIASGLDNVYVLDLNKYSQIASNPAYNKIHPTALGYQKLAAEISSMISYIISLNLNDFRDVQFIGTDYQID